MMKIGITLGDPLGVGPETIFKAWDQLSPKTREFLIVYGDTNIINEASVLTCITIPSQQISPTSSINKSHHELAEHEAAQVTLAALDKAIEDAMGKKIDALVTAPVNKKRIRSSLLPHFTGHTEYLAEMTDSTNPVMFFAPWQQSPSTRPLRVALATTHIPLQDVSKHLTKEKLMTTIQTVAYALKNSFHIPFPKIALLGLNPHAGEGGELGREEIDVIIPAREEIKKMENIVCDGPFPADAFFAHHMEEKYDAVIAMYHDQGLIPMKSRYPENAVNITLGLPFLRTSPGHGTAEDIAWKGIASPKALMATVAMTHAMLQRSKHD